MTVRYFEKVTRGAGHHRRIRALFLIEQQGALPLDMLASTLKTDYRNASQHLSKLHNAGLIEKHNRGRLVLHSLTPLGTSFLTFYRSIER